MSSWSRMMWFIVSTCKDNSHSVGRIINEKRYYLSLIETVGVGEYSKRWAPSNLRFNAFLFFYDITNHSSHSYIDHTLQIVDKECKHRSNLAGM